MNDAIVKESADLSVRVVNRFLRTAVVNIALSLFLAATVLQGAPKVAAQGEEYLTWSAQQAQTIGKSMRNNGRVGSVWGFRGLHTERAFTYKLRATWLTPEVIRASARSEQLRSRLSDDRTRALVNEAEAVRDTVIMVEIDPDEGSGVIPLDWQAFLQPKNLKEGAKGAVAGVTTPKLRDVKALGGVIQRDYNYDVFWVVFPLTTDNGEVIFPDSVREAELVVRIYNKEGRVSWPVPGSVRDKIRNLTTGPGVKPLVD